ncbi:hypothetical protein [Nakamurella antarctica]|uniref:hypothetical protein n=1 Tax=Nakamurella antarctica TaxID=1902245 RepID=UPI0013DD944E|nr:hypothetical protein [Nakamurella antarctica]
MTDSPDKKPSLIKVEESLDSQQPLGFLRPKALVLIGVVAILAALTFLIITLTKA